MPAKILVVDDEPDVERLILQRFRKKIRTKEYNFVFAQNGIEALEKLTQIEDIDVVLSDINMPEMDGLTFISKIHESNMNVKAVMVSAYGDMQNIRTAMNMGAYDFVTKPINFQDLELTIQKARREIEMLRLAELARKKLVLIQQELSVANEIQQSILPRNYSIFPTEVPFEIYAEMIPAKEVGGDFYDFFFIDEDHLGVVIGDVSGKGMPAALFMAVTRTLLKATGLKTKSPHTCFDQVNLLLSQDNAAHMFVTVFYAVLNIRTGVMEYASGGHNPPWIINPDGTTYELSDSQNIALGIVEEFEFSSKTIELSPGASLVLFTDGITEAIDKHQNFFSDERFEDYLKNKQGISPKEIVAGAIQEINTFSSGMPQADDITLLSVRRHA